jgi:hypothetical protein
MTSLLLTLLLTGAGAVSDCTSSNDAWSSSSSAQCVDRDATSTSAAPKGAGTASGTAHRDDRATRQPSDDEPWTYEPGTDDFEHVCITRGAGGICLESE